MYDAAHITWKQTAMCEWNTAHVGYTEQSNVENQWHTNVALHVSALSVTLQQSVSKSPFFYAKDEGAQYAEHNCIAMVTNATMTRREHEHA